jgi:hypothetical protein
VFICKLCPALGHPHSAKRGTTNSTWKDFEASPLRLRVEGFAAYIDASYSPHALLIKEHVLKNVLVLPACAPLTRCLPIVEITRVGELQTKPFIHDVNQQGVRDFSCSNLFVFRVWNQSLHEEWWRQTGSNRRPEACKATALPTELCPPEANSPRIPAPAPGAEEMVGLGRLELPTSRLSSARSNQLSYRPEKVQALHKRPEERET